MEPRLNMFENPVSAKFLKYLSTSSQAFYRSQLPVRTRELVQLRVSQINGCAFCVDMHTKEAAHAGESDVRLHLVAVWREATVYTEAERAALELAEAGTRIADAGGAFPQEVWAAAAKHYDEDQLAALVSLIAFMNAINRMNVLTGQPAGDYEVGWLEKFS